MNLAPAETHMFAELVKPATSMDCGYCGHPVDPNDPSHEACFTHRCTGREPKSFWAHGGCLSMERERRGLRPVA